MDWRAWTTAAVLVIAGSVGATSHSADPPNPAHHRRSVCRVHPHYSFSQRTVVAHRIARLEVRFPTTCGHVVRAVLVHPSAGGAVADVGNEIRGRRDTSTVVSRDADYCLLGWEVRVRHGWDRRTLHRKGHC